MDEVDAGRRGDVREGDHGNLRRRRHRPRRGERDLPRLLRRGLEDVTECEHEKRGNGQRRQYLEGTSEHPADDRVVLGYELLPWRRLLRALVSRPVGSQPPAPATPGRSPSKRSARCRS